MLKTVFTALTKYSYNIGKFEKTTQEELDEKVNL